MNNIYCTGNGLPFHFTHASIRSDLSQALIAWRLWTYIFRNANPIEECVEPLQSRLEEGEMLDIKMAQWTFRRPLAR